MKFVSREEWGARYPRRTTDLRSHDEGWFWHWLGPAMAGDGAYKMRGVQRYHMDTKGWSDIAYNWAVDQDGQIYEGRGWGVQGGATSGYNSKSYALVFLIGWGEVPTIEAKAAAEQVVAAGPSAIRNSIRPHSDVVSTTCPGTDIKKYITNRKPQGNNVTLEQAKNEIRGLYTALLGRPADDAGLEYWAGLRVAGTSLDAIRWEFIAVRLVAQQRELAALSNMIDGMASVRSTQEVVAAAKEAFLGELILWAEAAKT